MNFRRRKVKEYVLRDRKSLKIIRTDPLVLCLKRTKGLYLKAETNEIDLAHYFEHTVGTGILGTCVRGNMVNPAVYFKPFTLDSNTIAFVMTQKTNHRNL
jgi:hypothetical protein